MADLPLEQLTLEHRTEIHQLLIRTGVFLSEYSFANLYLFRASHDHRLLRVDGRIFLTGKTFDGLSYMMPSFCPAAEDMPLIRQTAAAFDLVFPVPAEWQQLFKSSGATISAVGGDSDYVYTTASLSTYQGQKLHSKKNLLNQFLTLYQPLCRPLMPEFIADAILVLEAWQKESGETQESTDYIACREAVEQHDPLVLCGFIYYVDHTPAGFILGEELGPEMFALHFAKARREFKGIYQYMFNHFTRALPPRYRFVNFEQDLDKQALRIAKTSYHPDHMLIKYRVRWS